MPRSTVKWIMRALRIRELPVPHADLYRKIVAAYDQQRDPINDSDLDDEQPITLTIRLQLGDVRRIRNLVRR